MAPHPRFAARQHTCRQKTASRCTSGTLARCCMHPTRTSPRPSRMQCRCLALKRVCPLVRVRHHCRLLTCKGQCLSVACFQQLKEAATQLLDPHYLVRPRGKDLLVTLLLRWALDLLVTLLLRWALAQRMRLRQAAPAPTRAAGKLGLKTEGVT
jgi:hypothetical protein